MAATLAPPIRLIEYPDEISDCRRLSVGRRELLYYIVESGSKCASGVAIVVLGYQSGQRHDIVTKDLIETVEKTKQPEITSTLLSDLSLDSGTTVLYL